MEENNDWTVETTKEEDKKIIQLGDIYCCTNDFTLETYEILPSIESSISLFQNKKIIYPLDIKYHNEVIFMVSYEFKEKPVDKSKLKTIIIDAVDLKNKENFVRVTNSDLNFEIPKTIKSLHKFCEFNIGFNKFEQTFIVYLYLYNNFYIIKLSLIKKKFELLYDKNLSSSQNSNCSLMLNYLTNNDDSRVFLYNKPNLIIFTYNYFKNINYEEKLLNLENINDKIKNIFVANFDLKNVFIITNLSSLFYFDYKSNKMSKVEDKYKFLCDKINLISNLTPEDPSIGNYQYFITEHRDKEKKVFYLKLWRMNLNLEICEKTQMLKIEFIQQLQFDYFINEEFDYKLSIKDKKIFLNLFDYDKLFILNIADHDKIFVIEKIYELNTENCNFTLTNSDYHLSINTTGTTLDLFTFISEEMLHIRFEKISDVKYVNFVKCLSPSDFKKDNKDKRNKSDKTKKNEVVNAFNGKIELNLNITQEKSSSINKLPDMKLEDSKKIEPKKERKNIPLSLNDEFKQVKEEIIIEKNIPKVENKTKEEKIIKKDKNEKQINSNEKQFAQKEKQSTNDKLSGSNKKLKKMEKNEIQKSPTSEPKDKDIPPNKLSINDKKEQKNELFDLNEIKLLLENKIKPSLDEKIKEDINQILDKNLSIFSENINKKFTEILNIFNREKETLENRKKVNLELFENITKLILKNVQNNSISTNNLSNITTVNEQIANQPSNDIKTEIPKQTNPLPTQLNNQKLPINNINPNSNISYNSNVLNPNLYNSPYYSNLQPNYNNYTNVPLNNNNNINSPQVDINFLLYYMNSQYKALQQQISLNNQILSGYQQSQGLNINPYIFPPNYNITPGQTNPIINQFQQQANRNFNQNIPSNIPFIPQNLNNNTNINSYLNTGNYNMYANSNHNQLFNSNSFNSYQVNNQNPSVINPNNQFTHSVNISQNPFVQSQTIASPKKISSNQVASNIPATKMKEEEKISLDIESEEEELSPEEEEKFLNMIREDLKTKGKKKKSGASHLNSFSTQGRLRKKKPKKK